MLISCACGCGTELEDTDDNSRKRSFVNGHNRRKYADPKQYQREWKIRNKASLRKYKGKYHRKRKVMCIEIKGGQCLDCGLKYDGKNGCIFHMHHRDPATKSFAVGNQVMNKAWSTILTELEKCDMLCANCHEKRHSEEF